MNLRLGTHELGQTEIQHLHSSVGGQEEVLGLEVPVDDALGVGRLAIRFFFFLGGSGSGWSYLVSITNPVPVNPEWRSV